MCCVLWHGSGSVKSVFGKNDCEMSIFRKRKLGTPLSAALNILGMTVAFAALYIILVQVHHDLTYNKGIKDADRIYCVSLPDWYEEDKYMVWLCRPPFEKIISTVPGIEAGGTGYLQGDAVDVIVGDGKNPTQSDPNLSMKMSSMNKGSLDVFGFELAEGSWENYVGVWDYAFSESAAKKYGLEVGGHILVRDWQSGKYHDANVVVIYKDMPMNSDLSSFEGMCPIGDQAINSWSEWSYPYYFKAKEGVSKEDLEASARKVMEEIIGTDDDASEEEKAESLKRTRIHLIPLTETYFETKINSRNGAFGNISTTYTLLAIALLVIIIAFINFINFFFALVPVRVHSVNTRKVLGASRASLIKDCVMEAVSLIVISLALAAAVVALFRTSTAASLITCSTAFGANISVGIFTILLGLFFAVAASLYPAFYITSFSPALALKGSFASSAKGRVFRYLLVGLQFLISITLIICATFIGLQRKFMMGHDMGFDREELVVANVNRTVGNAAETVTSKLMDDPQIKDITWADGDIVSTGRMGWGRMYKGEQVNFLCYPVAWNFLRFMGIPVLEGRDFTQADEQSENGVFIFNEAAKNKFGFVLDERFPGHRDEDADIVGFCRDFNFSSLKNEVSPIALYIFGKHPWRPLTTLFVRTQKNADVPSIMSKIRTAVCEIDPSVNPDDVKVQLFDKQLQTQYEREANFSRLITLFTLLAIIISLMGVFGLVMFETEYRRKEIGVRRVNGATVGEILKMFNVEFARIVLICFILAVPLSWWIVDRYLSGFAYRVPIHLWVFAAALLSVLLITALVVTGRSYKAATENPSVTLKKE